MRVLCPSAMTFVKASTKYASPHKQPLPGTFAHWLDMVSPAREATLDSKRQPPYPTGVVTLHPSLYPAPCTCLRPYILQHNKLRQSLPHLEDVLVIHRLTCRYEGQHTVNSHATSCITIAKAMPQQLTTYEHAKPANRDGIIGYLHYMGPHQMLVM